jgi:hypothetical protein
LALPSPIAFAEALFKLASPSELSFDCPPGLGFGLSTAAGTGAGDGAEATGGA